MENRKHEVFNIPMSKLGSKVIKEKLDEVINHLGCAAKIENAHGFVLRNIKTGE